MRQPSKLETENLACRNFVTHFKVSVWQINFSTEFQRPRRTRSPCHAAEGVKRWHQITRAAVMMLHLPLCVPTKRSLSQADPFIYTQKCWKGGSVSVAISKIEEASSKGCATKPASTWASFSSLNDRAASSRAACVTSVSTLRTRIFHIFLSCAVIDRCLRKIKHPSSMYARVSVPGPNSGVTVS